ncbi:glycosyltransferase [Cryobacterium sp. M15]|uniref:glycosyltransferase n=1 Tax=Cryobacterium sp. M15 TaxID=2048291 RepID=UPI0011B0CEC9|nr:glycosyltransferase [Cryobacterium sp. M15]
MAIDAATEPMFMPGDLDALRARLLEGWPRLVAGESFATGESTSFILDRLARALWDDPSLDRVWLAFVIVAGAFPSAEEVQRFRRRLLGGNAGDAFLVVLDCTLAGACREGGVKRKIRIVSDRPVVDVDFSATHGHNTGIQRVVRETLTRWASKRVFELAVWTEYGTVMRGVTKKERNLVLKWTSTMRTIRPGLRALHDDETIVPWKTTVVFPEVCNIRSTEALRGLARYSGNKVVAIGYDAIPIVSAGLVTREDSNKYAQYLSVVKYMSKVLAISDSAAEEFNGFADAVRMQGIAGPQVLSIPLPVDTVTAKAGSSASTSAWPVVLSVGTREFRKNQTSILVAAELLWREGLNFELVFVGGDAVELSGDFQEVLGLVKKNKRAVTIMLNVSDETLLEVYERARFSVFVSLHEGYGLPVGESLAHGTPVLASNYGSVGDIARQGGCVLVDPRDDDSIREAMRLLLTDDALVDSLKKEILARPTRSWDNYADELWHASLSTEVGVVE